MSKRIIWGCDSCGREAEGAMPPPGWLEASYFDQKADKYRRFAFCSQPCMVKWLQQRYELYLRRRAENNGKEVYDAKA